MNSPNNPTDPQPNGPEKIGDVIGRVVDVKGQQIHVDPATEEQRAADVEAKRIEHYARNLKDLLAQRWQAPDDADLTELSDDIQETRERFWTDTRPDYKDD